MEERDGVVPVLIWSSSPGKSPSEDPHPLLLNSNWMDPYPVL